MVDWLSFSELSGNGMSLIAITASTNPSLERTTTITVSTGTLSETVTIIQEAAELLLTISPSASTFPYTGGTQQFTIESTMPWVLSSYPNWLTFDTTAGTYGVSTITATTTGNTSMSDVSGSIVVSGESTSATATVMMEGVPESIIVTPSSASFQITGNTQLFTVNSNTDWTITSYPSWLTIDSLSGTSGVSVISATADANNYDYRDGDIVFSGTTASTSVFVEQDYQDLQGQLTFNIVSSGTINWKFVRSNTNLTRTIQYKKNGGRWTSITSTTAGTSFNVSAGDVVKFRGDNDTYGNTVGTRTDYNTFCGSTATFNVVGNIMSLIDPTEFSILDTFRYNSNFYRLFEATKVINASSLKLPAVNLSSNCYYGLFYNCSSLASTPTLPATALTRGCYAYMFYGCTALTTPPSLPATSLSDGCYADMFSRCTSLVSAPALPAETMYTQCYSYMFNSCTGLTTAPSLPAMTLAESCYSYMFNGCTSLTTAPTLPATSMKLECYRSMFTHCESLATAPALPATVLAKECYQSMFSSCYSLTTAPELPATSISDYCYYSMFGSCYSLTTAPVLPATSMSQYCYAGMFSSCSGLTVTPALPATKLATSCYSNMFYGCTSLVTTPVLPATTLSATCYQSMFYGCTALTAVTCMATDISASRCTQSWLGNVAPSGVFTKDPSMSGWTLDSSSGIPTGWTVRTSNEAPMLFKVASGGTIVLRHNMTLFDDVGNLTVQYSINGGQWTNMTASTGGTSINVGSGDIIEFKGDNVRYGSLPLSYTTFSGSTITFEAFCNTMSLINSTGFSGVTDLTEQYAFNRLFAGCTGMTSARHLVMPTTAPPMHVYTSTFEGCTSLTTAPTLPIITMTNSCCNEMFKECSSLNYVKCYATDVSAYHCTYNWLSGVSATGIFVKDANTSWSSGDDGIPSNWTVQDI